MKYALCQTIELDESGDNQPCFYIYDTYDTLEDAQEERANQLYSSFFLIFQVW